MVKMRRMTAGDRDAVLALKVSDDQTAFVDPIAETLSDRAPRCENFVIETQGVIVGFFQIDNSSGRQTIPESLELHEVAVDARHQGKGYGKAFILGLRKFLKDEFPEWPSACLTVNCRNPTAYRLYELGGFVDTGRLHLAGRSGPQHIMQLNLS